MSAALQRVLDRMPDEAHRQSFIRLISEAGIKEDSADMAILALEHEARWSAVQAMSNERKQIERLLADMPAAMRAAGTEIVRNLAGSIADETTNRVSAAGIAAMDSAADRFVGRGVESLTGVFGSLVAEARASWEPLRKAAAETSHAALIVQRDLRGWMAEMMGRTRLIAIGIVGAVMILSAGAGSGITYKVAYPFIYHAGYVAGAYVVRHEQDRR